MFGTEDNVVRILPEADRALVESIIAKLNDRTLDRMFGDDRQDIPGDDFYLAKAYDVETGELMVGKFAVCVTDEADHLCYHNRFNEELKEARLLAATNIKFSEQNHFPTA